MEVDEILARSFLIMALSFVSLWIRLHIFFCFFASWILFAIVLC